MALQAKFLPTNQNILKKMLNFKDFLFFFVRVALPMNGYRKSLSRTMKDTCICEWRLLDFNAFRRYARFYVPHRFYKLLSVKLNWKSSTKLKLKENCPKFEFAVYLNSGIGYPWAWQSMAKDIVMVIEYSCKWSPETRGDTLPMGSIINNNKSINQSINK